MVGFFDITDNPKHDLEVENSEKKAKTLLI